MSKSSFTPNQFQQALQRDLAQAEQIKFDQEYHKNVTLQQAANGALQYEQLGGNLIKDTLKGDWINPLLSLFFVIAVTGVLLFQNLSPDRRTSLAGTRPEYTWAPASPQDDAPSNAAEIHPSITNDLSRSPFLEDSKKTDYLGAKKDNKNRNKIEKTMEPNSINNQELSFSCPKIYIDSEVDKTPDIVFIYEHSYVSTDEGLSEDVILRPGKESTHCDLYIKNIEKTIQDISDLNLPASEERLNNKPPISISADTSILNPLNDNRAPDPYLIRLMLSSFR